MEILATYMAKDGKMFNDPLECEEYEKGLGIVSGSVADFIRYLNKECKPETYVHGLVYVKEPDGSKSIYQCTTVCVANKLDSFVNIVDLNTDQLFIKTTVRELVEWLERYDKDCPVHYFLAYSENIELKNVELCHYTILKHGRRNRNEQAVILRRSTQQIDRRARGGIARSLP